MKVALAISVLSCLIGCNTSFPKKDNPINAISDSVMIEWVTILICYSENLGVQWELNGHTVTKEELQQRIERFCTYGITKYLLKCQPNVPFSTLKETLDILRVSGIKEVNLWGRLNGIFMDEVIRTPLALEKIIDRPLALEEIENGKK